MDTKNLKSISIAAVIAVVAGVFMMGVNQAFGVDAPTQEPSTAGAVAPTFSGIKVTGKSTFAGGLEVAGASGAISNTSTSVKIDDDVWIPDSKSLTIGFTSLSRIKIDNDEIDSFSDLTINKGGSNIKLGGSTAATTSDLQVTGKVDVDGSLDVGGDLDVAGTFKTADSEFTGELSTQKLKAKDYVKLNRLFFDFASGLEDYELGTFESYILNDSGSSNANDDNFLIHAPNAIKLDNPSGWARLKYDGNFEVSKGIKVNGVATATRFGKYSREVGTFGTIPANNVYEANSPCPSGTYIVSCGGQGSDSTTYTATKWVTFSNLDAFTSNNTCYARGVNTSSSSKYVRAIAICLNPAL